jgi:hypothetical protein
VARYYVNQNAQSNGDFSNCGPILELRQARELKSVVQPLPHHMRQAVELSLYPGPRVLILPIN